MRGVLAIGIGCRRGCPADAIAGLVREALARVGHGPSFLRGDGHRPGGWCADPEAPPRLFTVADKAGEPGLRRAAVDLGLDLVILPRAALQAAMDRIAAPSPAAVAALGLASVSEAAALAGAGAGSRLLLPRIAAGGATCAIAEAVA